MKVTVTAVNPLEHAREIKELFAAHERPEFPDFFDRAYPTAFASGATSWIGRDASGRVVMHIACFPRRFRFRQREVVGGLLVNLMVDREHRSFFPALALVRHLVQDARARGDIDFLYADPNEESRALLRGTRFMRVGTLRRYVLPVGDRRRYVDQGIRLWHACLRLATGGRLAGGVVHPALRFHTEPFTAPPPAPPGLTAYHDAGLYASRLEGYPGERDWWFTCHQNGPGSSAFLALLVRGPDASGLAALRALRPGLPGPVDASLASCFPGLVAELRRLGCERLQVVAVAESKLARALVRCGFIPRRETVPLFALPLTALGEECVHSVRLWEITDLECDR